MSTTPRRWLGRTAAAIGAAMTMIVVAAGPAAADNLPTDTSVTLTVVDGFIQVGDPNGSGRLFPLGDDPPPSDDCATGADSVITADVGTEVNDVAPITNVQADFDETEVAQVFFIPICAEITIVNNPEGTQTQTGNGTGLIALDDPGPEIAVEFSVECVLDDVNIDLNGDITGTAEPWSSELTADTGFAIPPVVAGGDCSSFEANAINNELGLPQTPTEQALNAAEFVLEVTTP